MQRFGTERDLMGFARRFRPTYAPRHAGAGGAGGANVGRPSRGRGLRLDGQSLSHPPKITPLRPRLINEYLCDALHIQLFSQTGSEPVHFFNPVIYYAQLFAGDKCDDSARL